MPQADSITVLPATSTQDYAIAKELFTAYAASLPIDITYQGFGQEVDTLPGKYSPASGGALLLARSARSGHALGCVALRSIEAKQCCEMKRLYVTSDGRGRGIGKIILRRAVECARELGYRSIWLDTLPSMTSARAMYNELGFKEIDPYYSTPVEGTIFLGLALSFE